MEKYSVISKLKELIESNVNIIEYLKTTNNEKQNSIEDIMISYDLQAGSYMEAYNKDNTQKNEYCKEIVKIIDNYMGKSAECYNLIEIGIGEATTLGPVLLGLKKKPNKCYGFDISWSRIKYARKFLRQLNIENNVETFTADLFNIPMKDNSMDIVYTSHTIEPNGGREREALQELYRITNQYLILLEPGYEFASEEAKKRMERHGYITNLFNTAEELNYKIIEHRLLGVSGNELNPTALIIIEKNPKNKDENPFCCPLTNKDLTKENTCYYSTESMLAYPIVDEIPCLLSQNAIIATKYLE